MRTQPWFRALAVSAVTITLLLAGCGASPSSPASAPAGVSPVTTPTPATGMSTPTATSSPLPVGYDHPCIGAPAPATYDHVIWIVMENKPAGAGVGDGAPLLTAVANACGMATDYHAITHPSLPNYLAMTSGSAHSVQDDASPSAHPIGGSSIFSEATAAGGSWATYAESMPGGCTRHAASPYAVKHNPAAYYTALAGVCAANDVPLGTTTSGPLASGLQSGSLPSFSFVVPDLCNDTHDCSVSTGDRWLGQWLKVITSSPVYADGRTAVFVTWDEDDHGHNNAVDLVVVAPSVRPGTRAADPFSHLSLLRTTELMLGVDGSLVSTAPSMRDAFHL